MGLWTTLPSARFDVGSLWLPDFSFRFMYRDYALFSHPFDFEIDETTGTAGPTTNWTTKATFSLRFPDFDADTNLGAGTLTVYIRLKTQVTSGAVDFRIVDFGSSTAVDEITGGGTYQYGTTSFKYDASAGDTIPTGSTGLFIQTKGGVGDGYKFRKVYGEDGPRCYFLWSA